MENHINNKQHNNTEEESEENLKSKILDLIEREKIKPKSKLYFVIKDKAFWSLFILSVLIGSIAISIMIFSFTNSESGIYEVTHDSLIDFILEITPYMWVLLFATFAFVGYENFRHTDRGYKYSFSIILIGSLVLNVVGGVTLHALGVSKIIDQDFALNSSFLKSSDFTKKTSWNQPGRGVLSGEVVSFNGSSSTFILKDFNGNLWAVSSSYVPDISLDSISTSSLIRVIGIQQVFSTSSTSSDATASSTINNVVACYILPWNSNEYEAGISKIKGYLASSNDSERKVSDKRNSDCKAVKSYNIIRSMVELH